MKKTLLLLLLASHAALANCWVVDGLKGSSYAARNNYNEQKDGYSGTFQISINGKLASIKYSGLDAGGMSYMGLSPNTLMGMSDNGTQRVYETWIIQPDGTVMMSKSITGSDVIDSVKAMIGHVKHQC